MLAVQHRQQPVQSTNGYLPNFIRAEIKEFSQKLKDLVVTDLKISPELKYNGSLVCGHYVQPKPQNHSANPHCQFKNVIECDLRLIFPVNFSLKSDRVIEFCQKISGQQPRLNEISRFGDRIKMLTTYSYKKISDDLGLEFEICLNQRPYYEIADAWKAMFTPEEIQRQKQVRFVAREVLKVDYLSEFQPLKSSQTSECRYRICQNILLRRTLGSTFDFAKVPVSNMEDATFLNSRADLFLKDPAFIGSRDISDGLKAKFISSGWENLLVPVPAPNWLSFAESYK